MPEIKWTSEQRSAIETVDRDALVSAAAGSGKTAVLAERCAYLVADAPSPFRCDVDRLLVVTFTDAAAAEMRTRIHRSLRAKAAESPEDGRIRAQVALVDTAQISTLHAFCMWIIRRWFHRAGVDATSPILAQDEGILLRQETIDALFEGLYGSTDEFSKSFLALIEDYGLGSDDSIKVFVSRLGAFLESIPDPDAWLDRAGDDSPQRARQIIDETRDILQLELQRQASYCGSLIGAVYADWPACAFYCEKIAEYHEHLEDWCARVGGNFEDVRVEIEGFELSSKGVPRTSKNAEPEELDAKDRGKQAFEWVKKNLFQKRLRMRLCRFSVEEMGKEIEKSQPYVSTLVELTRRFREQYRAAKREISVMDFSDLERLAYELLTQTVAGEEKNPVAAELQERFAHVLVDEFQDINPLQANILSLVSRTTADRCDGNLFTVGDVKQSIYGFRLAEPNMFLTRARTLADEATAGVRINLQHNYRSTPTILEGVNLLFGALMSSACGGIEYDEGARLKAPDGATRGGEPIELHILERKISSTQDADEEQEFVDASDPAQWKSIEREAVLVGERIRELMASGFTVTDGGTERPLRYGDFCVLLRSVKQGARHVAAVLDQMGISCWAQQAADSFGQMEIREVLALLAIIDNVQQDIPLATVLRCGILGDRLTEDELVQVRAIEHDVDFYKTVQLYSSKGQNLELRAKLQRILSSVHSYRRQMRERPLADVLWSIYRETGYLSYVVGLRDGAQRRANLIALHDRARQFGQFRRQGLRRFLQFLDSLRERKEELGAASAHGESEDAVGIISIHHAKGLEYPVVFCMELGRRFNMGDSTGRLLFEREIGIGIKGVDRDRLIEYPTALHRACALAAEEASLAEELRVWYVATTRAKQKLILIGTEKLEAVDVLKAGATGNTGTLDPLAVLGARTPLTWFVGALAGDCQHRVRWDAVDSKGDALFDVKTYNEETISKFRIDDAVDADATDLWHRVAGLDELPESEPTNPQPTRAEKVMGRLEYTYPHLAVCSVSAVRSASEKSQPFASVVGEDDEVLAPRERSPIVESGARTDVDLALNRGMAVHAVMQQIALDRTSTVDQIAGELARLSAEGVLSPSQLELVDVEQIAWFFSTRLGKRIREHGDTYHREWMFLSSEPIDRFDPLVQGEASDRVLVRGVVDGVLNDQDELEIVDYKTDRINKSQIDERAELYRRQLGLYASAASSVFGKRVRSCHLVFLHPMGIWHTNQ